MELTNEFTVDVPLARAWAVLTDVELIAPCLPGAQLQEIEGDEYRGVVKVKVGPITAQYKGAATFVEQDEAAGRVVLQGKGRDTKGQGNASALITAQLTADGPDRTQVAVVTDLTVTGKVAQFGRGVMADVSSKLMAQFADNLSARVLAPAEDSPAEPVPAEEPEPVAHSNGSTPSGSTVRTIDQPDAEAIDLVGTAGGSLLRRSLPLIGCGLLILLLMRALRRRG